MQDEQHRTQVRSREFRDNRHGAIQCCCSSYSRQFFLTILPLLILVIIVIGLNNRNIKERSHTSQTVTVSSGGAVAMLVGQTFQAQIDVVATLAQLVTNKLWTDPYAVDEFLNFAFPLFAIDPTVHRIGVTQVDVGISYMALTDITEFTMNTSAATGGGSFATPGWLELRDLFGGFRSNTHELAEFQARLHASPLTTGYVRTSGADRTSTYEAMASSQTPGYTEALRAGWISLAAGLLNADGSLVSAGRWGQWLLPESAATSANDPARRFPSLVFVAPVVGRQTQPGGQILARVAVNAALFATLFETTSLFTQRAFFVDQDTRFVVASSVASSVMQPVSNVSELNPFSPELFGTVFPREIPPDGRSSYTVIMTRAPLDFANYTLVTFATGNTMAIHNAAVQVFSTVFDPCVKAAAAIRYMAQSGDLYDLQDVPHVESTVSGLIDASSSTIGKLWMTTGLRLVLHALSADAGKSLTTMETWWPDNGTIPLRRYTLGGTTGNTDAGSRLLLRNRWTDYPDPSVVLHSNPGTPLLAAHDAVVGRRDGTVVVRGPNNELDTFCSPVIAAGVSCDFHYMTASVCAAWPSGGRARSVAETSLVASTRSCFHSQFTIEGITRAIIGMRLDLVGITVVLLSDGTVLAAAGDGIPLVASYNGTAKVWNVVPGWTQGGFQFIKGGRYGEVQTTQGDDRSFIIDVVDVPASVTNGPILVLTVIRNVASRITTRDYIVYAVDFLVFFALLLFALHAVNFVWRMRDINRIAGIVNHGAELQTDDLPDEALRVSSTNKDIESMLISSVQLFLHMKRIRHSLPTLIVERHQNNGIVSGRGAAGAPLSDAAFLSNAAARQAASTSAAETASTSGVFTSLQDTQVSSLTRRQVVLVSMFAPSVKMMSAPGFDKLFLSMHSTAAKYGGSLWLTDANLTTHFYFDGDCLSRALEAAKEFCAITPDGIIFVARDEIVTGVLAPDAREKTLAFMGPVLNTVQCMAGAVREIIGAGEIAAAAAGVDLVQGGVSGRVTAPLIMDRDTLLRVDPSSLSGCPSRRVGALGGATTATDLSSPDEVAEQVRSGGSITAAALSGRNDCGLDLREVMVVQQEERLLTEFSKLLWNGIGDAASALCEGQPRNAADLIRTVRDHAQDVGGDIINTRWDRALLFAISRLCRDH